MFVVPRNQYAKLEKLIKVQKLLKVGTLCELKTYMCHSRTALLQSLP